MVRKRKDRLTFKRIPVAADGSFERTYTPRQGTNRGGSIRGAFYGDGQAEAAGTFDKFGILGAFGARKVTN
ncbi:MAG: hypothetical protein GDA47_01750 [Rhodospirillales bacterium]|nr:hypothetical protein [Rhodospirillales bacterium]